jgi:uncharacterized protein (DUF924 family)
MSFGVSGPMAPQTAMEALMLWLFNSVWAPEGLGSSTREGYAELMRAAGREARQPDPRPRPLSPEETAAVIKFWAEAGPQEWFGKRPAFDRSFRERFLTLYERVARIEQFYPETAEQSLALLILLDQFPRNAFRGTPRMYATDTLARSVADNAVRLKHDRMVQKDLRMFFYLPFAHSEVLADQDRSVALNASLPEPSPTNSRRHRDIIRRFGRFPHRNPILHRAMRPEEQRYLDEGGYAG